MTGAMAAFTVNDTFLKLLGTDLPLFQILLLRSIGVIVVLGFFARRGGAVRIPRQSRDRWLILIRSIAEAAAAWFFSDCLFLRRCVARSSVSVCVRSAIARHWADMFLTRSGCSACGGCS